MNVWFLAAAILLAAIVPLGVICLLSPLPDAVVALQTARVLATLALLSIAVGAGRSPYADVAILTALLDFGGGMVFARFLDRTR